MNYRYTPYYCEENIYLLAEQFLAGSIGEPLHVLFITNAARTCALLHQKAASTGKPVVWDYHVILLSGSGPAARIWDFDTRLDFPCPAIDYLARTFPADAPTEYQPLFRSIPAVAYMQGFSSDRRHMRAADGSWLKPPPAWPCLRGNSAASPHELGDILNLHAPGWGSIDDIVSLRARLTGAMREGD